MKRLTAALLTLMLVTWPLLTMMHGVTIAQSQGRVDFVKLGAIKVFKTNGNMRVYPATAAGLDAAVDALAAGDTLETWGSYTLTDDLEFDVDGVVWNANKTTITRAGVLATVTADKVTINDLNTDGEIETSGAEYLRFNRCRLDGNAQTNALELAALSHFTTLTDCVITRGATYGVLHNQVNGTRYVNCTIDQCTQDGLYFRYDATATAAYRGCGAAGVDATKYHPPVISGCHIINNGRYGVFAWHTHDLVITGCNIERNTTSGVYISRPIQTVISGNEFERNGGTSPSAANSQLHIFLGGSDSEFDYSGCTVVGNHFAQDTVQGIYVEGNSATVYHVNIGENDFHWMNFDGTAAAPSTGVKVLGYEQEYTLKISNNLMLGKPGATLAGGIGITVVGDTNDMDGTRVFVHGNVARGFVAGCFIEDIDNAKVSGNFFGANTNGILLDSSASIYVKDNFLANNNSAAIATQGTGPSYIATGNVGLSDNTANGDALTVAGTTPGAGGLAVLDDANAAAIRTTIGVGETVTDAETSNETMTTSGTFYDGASVDLTAGTWLITGTYTMSGSTTNERCSCVCKLWNGTTVAASGTDVGPAVSGVTSYATVTLTAIVTLAGNETWKMSATGNANNQVQVAQTTAIATNTANTMTAVRIAN